MTTLADFAADLASGAVRVVDLTHRLDPDFPVIVLPPEFGQCARFRMEEVSAYDHRGPAWKWRAAVFPSLRPRSAYQPACHSAST